MFALARFTETAAIKLTAPVVEATLWLVVMNSIGATMLLLAMIERGRVNRVVALFFLVPAVAGAMARVVLGESFSTEVLLGFATVAIGVVLTTRTRQEQLQPAMKPA